MLGKVTAAYCAIFCSVVSASYAADLNMISIELLPSIAAPQVIGGSPASAHDWPATFVFKDATGEGCTATAVGPRVILTAAHCIQGQERGTVSTQALTAAIVCESHPSYHAKGDAADFALCRLTVDSFSTPLDGFETINVTDAGRPSSGEKVVLLGYGCTTAGGSDRNFGVLYQGDATVIQTQSADSLFFRTYGDPGVPGAGVALCFGDSGGGAFHYINAAKTRRRIFGVNFVGDNLNNSWIAATANPTFASWASTWIAKYGLQVCGLNTNAAICRR